MKITDEFRAYFAPEDLAELDRDPAIIYGLTPSLELALLNEGWFEFARQNGADEDFFRDYGLGASYRAALPEALLAFFETNIVESIEERDEWIFDFPCPSPTHQREYRMLVMPLPGGRGCLVKNIMVVETPHDDPGGVSRADYKGSDGLITQCSQCQCVRRGGEGAPWDWVPAALEWPRERISHGLCPTCMTYLYPAKRLSTD